MSSTGSHYEFFMISFDRDGKEKLAPQHWSGSHRLTLEWYWLMRFCQCWYSIQRGVYSGERKYASEVPIPYRRAERSDARRCTGGRATSIVHVRNGRSKASVSVICVHNIVQNRAIHFIYSRPDTYTFSSRSRSSLRSPFSLLAFWRVCSLRLLRGGVFETLHHRTLRSHLHRRQKR